MANQMKRSLCAALLISSLSSAGSHADEGGPALGNTLSCPSTSNCVNSLGEAASLPPLRFSGSADDGKARLLRTLAAFPEARMVSNEMLQVEAVFTTFLGFRDQVLFRIDAASQRIDFRSRSNVGRYDFGKNRARMLEFSARFAQEPERSSNE
jgi:uncharacterized protein (DUF1499 family)